MLEEQRPDDTAGEGTPGAPPAGGDETTAAPPAKKSAAKKAAARKRTATAETSDPPAPEPDEAPPAKKAARKRTAKKAGSPGQPTEQRAAEPSGAPTAEPAPATGPAAEQAPAAATGPTAVPLFQPPPAQPAAASAGPPAERPVNGSPKTEPGDVEHPDGSEESSDAEDAEGAAARRRRRRGGRRRRKSDDGATEGSADPGTDPGGEPDQPGDRAVGDLADDAADAAEPSEGGSTRRRRRRRRATDTDIETDDAAEQTVTKVRPARSAEDEITGFTGSTRLEAKKQRRREGREAGRRRAPIVSEAEFLARREAVDRTMVIRQRRDLTQIAVLEDRVLVEHYVARESQTSLIGNVYLGRVQNVLPSMEAAFIDIGKGRNAVLYAGEVNWDALGAKDGSQRKIEQVLKAGQAVLVQVTKDPVGHKGARLTSQVSLPGRFLVYVPAGATSGISRKLPDNERNRLKTLLKEIVPDSAGVIVRTAAEGASEEELTRDVERLKALWTDIEGKVESGNAPALLYAEPDLTLKVVRDLFTEDIAKLVVSGDDAWGLVEGYVLHVAPDLAGRLERHDDSEQDAFAEYRIDEQIAKALDRKVWLPSGGSLVIDRTEAMTVVDVNTGKFTGSGGNLEETVTKNNLEAAEEIVRQLRLRDIGGIIVVDFIDMVLESNRDLVLRRLIECLGRDRTRHQVAEVTSLGLVQMTRKRIGTGLLEAFSEVCETCQGRGVLVHQEPVEHRKRHSEEEPRRGRRSRSRSKPDATTGSVSDADAAEANGGKRPTPAEFAAMAGAEPAKEDGAEPQAGLAASAPEPSAPEPSAPEPDRAEAVPAGPRIVTSVRRVGAHRPAGPATSGADSAPAQPAQADASPPDEEPLEGDAAMAVHVPVKRKGARKR